MNRTVTIHSSRFDDFLSELQKLEKSLKQKGLQFIINDEEEKIHLDGIAIEITKAEGHPYIITMQGPEDKKQEIEEFGRIFSQYSRSNHIPE